MGLAHLTLFLFTHPPGPRSPQTNQGRARLEYFADKKDVEKASSKGFIDLTGCTSVEEVGRRRSLPPRRAAPPSLSAHPRTFSIPPSTTTRARTTRER